MFGKHLCLFLGGRPWQCIAYLDVQQKRERGKTTGESIGHGVFTQRRVR